MRARTLDDVIIATDDERIANASREFGAKVSNPPTFATGDAPLGLAFLADGRALIVTTTSFMLFDPISGATTVVDTLANLGKKLAVPLATFPLQIVLTALSTNADRTVVYGIADSGSAQAFYRFDLRRNEIFGLGLTASPRDDGVGGQG